MLRCPRCEKEIVIYGVSRGAASDDDLRKIREGAEKDGRLVLFNPPPFGPYRCPRCRGELEEAD